MEVYAKIRGIKYKPYCGRSLPRYNIKDLEIALKESGSFILKVDELNSLAVSWWVSPKRTRSYPYARVYDTLGFSGRRVTVIPIMKDEGRDGDRDFLQWDTVSLMSLLGVYVIIAYYDKAERNLRYKDKLTNQVFNSEYIEREIRRLIAYQSDPLHWNLDQVDRVPQIAKRRIKELQRGKENFMKLSREASS